MLQLNENINVTIMALMGFDDIPNKPDKTIIEMYRSIYVKTIARNAGCSESHYALVTGALLEPVTKARVENIPSSTTTPLLLTFNPRFLPNKNDEFILRLCAVHILFHMELITVARIDNILYSKGLLYTIDDVINYFDGDPNLIE